MIDLNHGYSDEDENDERLKRNHDNGLNEDDELEFDDENDENDFDVEDYYSDDYDPSTYIDTDEEELEFDDDDDEDY